MMHENSLAMIAVLEVVLSVGGLTKQVSMAIRIVLWQQSVSNYYFKYAVLIAY